ncbi:hypothetical protein [Streptomyces sp. KR80]|uniref:hypothetical protein n=1 Tax=Streptomyces sp. KR80 TaxID=3457426 RepID=UPI003FD4DE91
MRWTPVGVAVENAQWTGTARRAAARTVSGHRTAAVAGMCDLGEPCAYPAARS